MDAWHVTMHRSCDISEFFADILAQPVYACPFMHGHVLKSPLDRLDGRSPFYLLISSMSRTFAMRDQYQTSMIVGEITGSQRRFQAFSGVFWRRVTLFIGGREICDRKSGRCRRNCENVDTFISGGRVFSRMSCVRGEWEYKKIGDSPWYALWNMNML